MTEIPAESYSCLVTTAAGHAIAGLTLRTESGDFVSDRFGVLQLAGEPESLSMFDRFGSEVPAEIDPESGRIVVDFEGIEAHLSRPVLAIEALNPLRPDSLNRLIRLGGPFEDIATCNPWLRTLSEEELVSTYLGDPLAASNVRQAVTVTKPLESANLGVLALPAGPAVVGIQRAIVEKEVVADLATRFVLAGILADRGLSSWIGSSSVSESGASTLAAGLCDPELPPLPWDPDEPLPDWPFRLDPEELNRLECVREYLNAAERNSATYRIDAVDPPFACAGDEASISGLGFGSTPGSASVGGIQVEVTRWSDTEITFQVPDRPISGVLAIGIPGVQEIICEDLVEFPPTSETFVFYVAGPPSIELFGPDVVEPGEPIPLSWRTPNANGAVTLTNPLTSTAVAPNGSTQFLNTNFPSTTELQFSVTVTTNCGSASDSVRVLIHRVSEASLRDIEITQGVQFFEAGEANHMVGTTFAGTPNNSVRLIPGKATIARAYVEGNQDPQFNLGRTLSIDVSFYLYPLGQTPGVPLGTVRVDPPPITQTSTVAQRRGVPGTSADVLIPPQLVDGTPFQIKAFASAEESPDRVANGSAETDLLMSRQVGPVRLVPIGVTLTNPALSTTGADFSNSNLRAQLAPVLQQALGSRLPAQSVEIWGAFPGDGLISYAGDVTTLPGFDGLIDRIANIASDYATGDWIFVGIIPWAGMTPPPGALGGARNRAAAIFWPGAGSWPAEVSAHEIMHLRGLDATPTGHIDSPDSRFPRNAYGYGTIGIDTATGTPILSVGEFGVDVEAFQALGPPLTIFNPATSPALMNPGSNVGFGLRWTSPYSWLFVGGSVAGGGGLYSLPEDEVRALHVRGTIDTSDESASFETPYSMVRPRRIDGRHATPSGYLIQVTDDIGNSLTEWVIPDTRSTASQPLLAVDELLPIEDHAISTVSVVASSGATLAQWTSSATPEFHVETLRESSEPDALEISPANSYEYVIWQSCNRSQWHRIRKQPDATGRLKLHPEFICRFVRIVATDGARSAAKEIELPGQEHQTASRISYATSEHGDLAIVSVFPDLTLGHSEQSMEISWFDDGVLIGKGRSIAFEREALSRLSVSLSGAEPQAIASLAQISDESPFSSPIDHSISD